MYAEPKFKLNQKLNIKWIDMTVPIVITKRLIIANPDTQESMVYYDYKHDLPNGYDFTKVSEKHLNTAYQVALNEYVNKLVNK